MSVNTNRASDSTAWLWLKSEVERLAGAEAAAELFRVYNQKLHDIYLERRRSQAAVELEELQGKLEAARLSGADADARRIQKMINSRLALLS